LLSASAGIYWELTVDNKSETLNSDYCKKALEKVGNPNILVNLISRRVRQLTSGGGSGSRPLIAETATMGLADIALLELLEDKMGWDYGADNPLAEAPAKKRSKKA